MISGTHFFQAVQASEPPVGCQTQSTTENINDVFGDGTGLETIPFDYSPDGLSGTHTVTWVGTPAYSNGVFDGCANFTATPIYLNTNISYTEVTDMTVSFWFKRNGLPTNSYHNVLCTSTNLYGFIGIHDDGATIYITNNNASTVIPLSYIQEFAFYTIVYDGTAKTVDTYRNGIKIDTGISVSGEGNFSSTNWRIGRSIYADVHRANAKIDQLRVISRKCTEDEIKALYYETSLTTTVDTHDVFADNSAVATYQLDTIGATTPDLGGTYDGTCTNVTSGTGVFGDCAIFNGTSSKLDTSAPVSFPCTLSARVKLNGTTAEIFSNGDGYTVAYLRTLLVKIATNSYEFWVDIRNYGTGTYLYKKAVLTGVTDSVATSFTHYAIVINAVGDYGVYVDGVYFPVSTTRATNGTPSNPDSDYSLGYYWDVPNGYTYGSSYIDQARILNRALTQGEVQVLYTELPVTSTIDTHDVFCDSSAVATYQLNGDVTDLGLLYDGTNNGVTFTDGVFGQCGVFNGTSSYFTASPVQIGDGDFAVSFRMKTDGAVSRYIMKQGQETTARWFGVSIYAGGTIGGGFKDDVTPTSIDSGFTPTTGEWYHVVFMRDGAYARIFIDGVLINSVSGSTTGSCYEASDIHIGRRNTTDSWLYFDGSLEQIRFYNKALTSEEVTQLYREYKV